MIRPAALDRRDAALSDVCRALQDRNFDRAMAALKTATTEQERAERHLAIAKEEAR